jgi:conjugative relaxase-like TrwC/TraI family protein
MPAFVSLATLSAKNRRGAWAMSNYYAADVQMAKLDLPTSATGNVTAYYTNEMGAHWWGDGLAALDLEAGSVVDPKHFERLLLQRDPHFGHKLPNNGGQRATISMFDATLSLPKELSALVMLGGAEFGAEIESIGLRANEAMLSYIQERAAMVRRGPGGIMSRGSSGLAVLTTGHTSARPVNGQAAPHVHFHNCILNQAELDGVFTALDAKALFNLQKTAAAIAAQIIEEETAKRFGFRWVRDEAGVPRLEGFDALVRQRLSLRQEQILDQALSEGIDVTDREQVSRIQRISRSDKSVCGNDEETWEWAKAMLLSEGVTFDSIMEEVRALGLAHDQTLEDRRWIDANSPQMPEDKLAAGDWRIEVARALANRSIVATIVGVEDKHIAHPGTAAGIAPDWARFERAMAADARDPEVIREEAAHEALLSVGRSQSTWREKDLHTALCLAGFPIAEAITRATKFMAGYEVVHLTGTGDSPRNPLRVRWDDQPVYVLTELLEMEQRILSAAREGVGRYPAHISEAHFEAVLEEMAARGKVLDEDSDQYAMVRTMFFGGHLVGMIAGQAGSGKSAGAESYSIVLEAGFLAEQAGYLGELVEAEERVVRHRVVGCALAAAAAENLEHSSKLPSYSLMMLTSRLASGAIVLEEGATIIVDEASQASTADLYALLGYVEAVDGQLVLMGDPRQLQAVLSGGMYKTLIDQVPEATTYLDETRRQNNLEERAMLALFHDRGKLRPASIKALRSQGVDKVIDLASLTGLDEKSAAKKLADWYIKNGRARFHTSAGEAASAISKDYWDTVGNLDGDASSTLVLTHSNAEIQILDRALVREAVERRRLSATSEIEFGHRSFLIGQRVVSRKVDRVADMLNGYTAVVLGVETVIDSWTVELSSPSPYMTTRTLAAATRVGDEVTVAMRPSKVATERKSAATDLERRDGHVASAQARLAKAQASASRCSKLIDKARDRRSSATKPATMEAAEAAVISAHAKSRKARDAVLEAEMKVAYSEAKYADARRWNEWARALPDDGGDITMTVEEVSPKNIEKRLVVELEDGTKRLLKEKFAEHHLDSGYALTTQRGQGQTVRRGIEYGKPTYTGMTRGTADNDIHEVVQETDPAAVIATRKNLEAAHQFLASREVDGKPGAAYLKDAAAALRVGAMPKQAQISDQLRLRMELGADTELAYISREIARATALGDRAVAVTKTHDRAVELSNAVVGQLVTIGGGTVRSAQIGDGAWVPNMPVVLARGEIEGLTHGATYFVATVSRHGMIVETADGQRRQLSAEQVRNHLDSGLALTTKRIAEGTDATALLVEAEGLADFDLEWIESQSMPVTLVVTDAELAGEHAWDLECRAKLEADFEDEMKLDPRSYSATYFLKQLAGEKGLDGLQATFREAQQAVYDAKTHTPRELAALDLEREMIAARTRRKDLEARSREDELSPEDLADAQAGIVNTNVDLAGLDERYQAVIGDMGDDDPSIVAEMAASRARHAPDAERLAASAEQLTQYAQARVTIAMNTPRPYHEAIVVDSSRGLAEDEKQRRELIFLVEEYRVRWGVTDPYAPLGETPGPGRQQEEWAAASRALGVSDGQPMSHAPTQKL